MTSFPWPPGPDVVELPDGRRLRAGPIGGPRPQSPEFAVYLLGWRPPPTAWPRLWVPWPDFGVPLNTRATVLALRLLHERAAEQRVEVACRHGRGRTGSAVALLAVLSGVPAADAVAWARQHHHPGAAETPGQKAWVRRTGSAISR